MILYTFFRCIFNFSIYHDFSNMTRLLENLAFRHKKKHHAISKIHDS